MIYRIKHLDLSPMSVVCTHYQALHWISKSAQESTLLSTTMFKACCKKGAVQLANFQASPRILQQFLEGIGPQKKHF